jgi:molybdopterin converting factor small subunit
LDSMLVAVNNEYGQHSQLLHESDEIAIIPPVSGG